MYAPRAMNRLCPKLSTSIRPNTSVRPDAAMKTIMPIARPAKVSVSQVELEPTAGQAASAIAADEHERQEVEARLRQRLGRGGGAGWCAGGKIAHGRAFTGGWRARGRAACAAAPRRRRARHLAAVDDPSVVHHRDAVAERLGHREVLLDEEDRRRGRLQLAQGGDQVLHDRRREPLARLVDQEQAPRLDHRPGDREHLLLPPESLPAG
jgi:hypothetical protein